MWGGLRGAGLKIIKVIFFLAIRFSAFFRGQNRRGKKISIAQKSLILSTICCALCVIPFVVTLALSSSMINAMTSRLVHLSSAQISLYTWGGKNALFNLSKEISALPSVAFASPEVRLSAMALGGSTTKGALVRAVSEDLFLENEYYNGGPNSLIKIVSGDFTNFSGKSAIITETLADDLGLGVGDTLKLVNLMNKPSGAFRTVLNLYKIKAVISSGYQELDRLWIFVPLKAAPVNRGDQAFIAIESKNRELFSSELIGLKDYINENFRGRGHAVLWSEVNRAQFENFSSTKLLLLFVILVIASVACVFTANSVFMLAEEKKRELKILFAFGAGGATVSGALVLVSFVVSAVGVAVGLPFGLLVAKEIRHIVNFLDFLRNGATRALSFFKGEGGEFTPSYLMDPAYYLTDITIKISAGQLLIIAFTVIILSALFTLFAVRNISRRVRF